MGAHQCGEPSEDRREHDQCQQQQQHQLQHEEEQNEEQQIALLGDVSSSENVVDGGDKDDIADHSVSGENDQSAIDRVSESLGNDSGVDMLTSSADTNSKKAKRASLPTCPHCHGHHPAEDKKGHFCTKDEQGFLESIVAMITLGLVCGWCHLLVLTMGLLLLHSMICKSIYTLAAFFYVLGSFFWPVDNRCFPRDGFVNSWLFTVWRRYFNWQCVIETPLDPNKRYMFAEMPHGIMPVGQFLSCSVVRQAFPGVPNIAGVAADMILRMPGMRSMYALMGIRRAGRTSILNMFGDKINVAVVVGGIAEMFMVSKTKEMLYLKKRKNFTKIAVEAGADIVPVYFFGNSLLHNLVGEEGPGNWLYKISRKFKTAFVLFYGRFGTAIPKRKQLKMVVGRPISIVQSDHPSEEYVESIHAELVKRVEELYYKHRPEWETRELVIF